MQNEIRRYLGLDEQDVVFDFRKEEGVIALDLITINPRHQQSFLFHAVRGTDKVDALRKMMTYVTNYREERNSYTIQWMAVGEQTLNTSYFHAHNMYEVLDKLYYGRDLNSIKVYSIIMNPVS